MENNLSGILLIITGNISQMLQNTLDRSIRNTPFIHVVLEGT